MIRTLPDCQVCAARGGKRVLVGLGPGVILGAGKGIRVGEGTWVGIGCRVGVRVRVALGARVKVGVGEGKGGWQALKANSKIVHRVIKTFFML